MIVIFKGGTFVDFGGVKWFGGDGLRCIDYFGDVLFIVFFCLLLEGGVGVDVRVIFNSGSVAYVSCSEDVVVFSFVHLNLQQLYNNLILLVKVVMSREDLFKEKSSFHLDDFIIKDQIGMGKFGAVYKAIDKKSQMCVAIKIIPKKTISSEILYTQLKREIQVQSRLKHSSICQLYAYFHDTNNVFMVLEYCPGGSLAFIIKERKEVLSDKKIAEIFLQLVYGLAYMHARHVMHRDLKLQNILLDEENKIKISDFGWCIHHPSRRDTFCGTMEYISPEMLNKESYEHSIDVYCLGIILYEMFYFRSPFLGQNQAETIKNIKEGKLVFDDEVRVVCDQAKNLIRRLLDRDPLKRPKARELFQDQFVTMNQKSSSQVRRRRLTEQTFIEFKKEIFKLSQTHTQSKQTVEKDGWAQENKENIVSQSQASFAENQCEEKENETPIEQAKDNMQSPKQEQAFEQKNENEDVNEYIAQRDCTKVEQNEQTSQQEQKIEINVLHEIPEKGDVVVEIHMDIDEGVPQTRQAND